MMFVRPCILIAERGSGGPSWLKAESWALYPQRAGVGALPVHLLPAAMSLELVLSLFAQ